MVITPHQFFEERALKKYFNKRGPHTSWYNYWYSQGSKDHKGDFATHRSSFYQSCCYYLKSQSLAWKRSWIGLELKNGSKLDATAKVLCQSCVNPNAIHGCHRPKWPIQKNLTSCHSYWHVSINSTSFAICQLFQVPSSVCPSIKQIGLVSDQEFALGYKM